MNQEIIGQVGGEWEPGPDLDWAYDMALSYLRAALGAPGEYVAIELVLLDHELGSYPAIAVQWDIGLAEPRVFIRRAKEALETFDAAIDWFRVRPSNFWFEEDQQEESDEE